eukprot:GHVR01156607.1.p1 GENE.GHVR01156607.1~~GHVR01156607.1.p1  ORF type:complete len:397 (+),score=57.92 GHVR01156607.1:129-1319(+)
MQCFYFCLLIVLVISTHVRGWGTKRRLNRVKKQGKPVKEQGKPAKEQGKPVKKKKKQAPSKEFSPGTYIKSELKPSQVIKNEFMLIKYLAEGTYGKVYEICSKSQSDPKLCDRRYAMKVQTPTDEEAVDDFDQETLIMTRITEKTIPFFNYFVNNYYCPRYMTHAEEGELYQLEGFVCTLLEFAPNGDMQTRKKVLKDKLNHYQFANMLRKWITQILTGLFYLHKQNIIHHDIKDANIFLDSNDNVKIGDFGLSRYSNKNGQSDLSSGSPYFMAPELFDKETRGVHDNKVDIFAVGVMLWTLCSSECYGKEKIYPWSGWTDNMSKVNEYRRSSYDLCEEEWAHTKNVKRKIKVNLLVNYMLERDPSQRKPAGELLQVFGTTPKAIDQLTNKKKKTK